MIDTDRLEELNLVIDYAIGGLSQRSMVSKYRKAFSTIKKILKQHNVQVKKSHKWTDERKAEKSKTPHFNIGLKWKEQARRENIVRKIHLTEPDYTIDRYGDIAKLKFLSSLYTDDRQRFVNAGTTRQAFMDKFYFDKDFNAMYSTWLAQGKPKWIIPSLDHKTPLSKGGSWELDNLHFMTWFENRAKADMTFEEWTAFKAATNTTSDLFIGGK